ncbi:MAG: hypothetical protein NT074_04265 [Methanomicrobiales archaeon]|nr:hypothetical protein [Methanomicrobiales archaeon]
MMGRIGEKIGRLPPAQQQEVEDFIDFLLSRSALSLGPPGISPFLAPDTVPLLSTQGASLFSEASSGHDEILPDYSSYDDPTTQKPTQTVQVRQVRTVHRREEKAQKILDWIE